MQRESLLVVLVATIALLSFSVGAASIDTANGRDEAQMSPDDSEIENDGRDELDPSDEEIDPPAPDGGARALLPSVPTPALGVLVGVVAIALVALWRFAGGDAAIDETSGETPTMTTPDAAPATSHTSTTIDVPLTNEVYRAWSALESSVDPDGVASTPRELADEATASGADPDAVETLRKLFERVRYGGADPNEERESRARVALESATDSVESATDGAGLTGTTDSAADEPTGEDDP